MKKILILFIAISLFIGCKKNNYTIFLPIEENDFGFYQGDTLKSKEDIENLVFVLDYYGIDYYVDNENIYIDKKKYSNTELMYNYTLKSRDNMWIDSRKNDSNTFD